LDVLVLLVAVGNVALELLVMHLDSLGDLFDVAGQLLDQDARPVDVLVESGEASVGLLEPSVDLLQSSVDIRESFLHSRGDLLESIRDNRCQLSYFHDSEATSVLVTSQGFYIGWSHCRDGLARFVVLCRRAAGSLPLCTRIARI
jgi:hypothetical protein